MDSKGRIQPKFSKKKGNSKHFVETYDALEQLCLKLKMKKPKVINLTNENKLPEKLVQTYYRCDNEEKDLYLYCFLKQHMNENTIVFANSISCVKRVLGMLKILGVTHQFLHSKMQQRARLKNLDRFKKNIASNTGLLVCTDVAARGLDIPFVHNVVHYQMPLNAEIYVHRCGRTARIGRDGLAFALFAPQDEKNFFTLCRVLGLNEESISQTDISLAEINSLKKQIESAKKFEKALYTKEKKQKRADWMLKLSKETGIDMDDELRDELDGLAERE